MNMRHIILAWPKHLDDPKEVQTTANRSWIQLAKTGSFKSNRYGEFSITKDDLSQMLHNFREVTPKAPTELPIDFDHLSMDPKKPGDGIAAGWLKNLELRDEGHELWGEVEWTPDAAKKIEAKEYRFVSPSFVKDHTHKDGKKIGTTLLAAAITNHPFLEGMSALTLYNFSVMGDLAVAAAPTKAAVVHLAEIGQRVTFQPDAERTPELSDEQRQQTFVVKTTIGAGDNEFVRLTRLDGTEFGWFRVSTQLAPAPARTTQEDTNMKTKDTDIDQKAAAFAQRVTALSKGRTLRDAISLAMAQDPSAAEAYRALGVGATVATQAEPAPMLSLSARSGETFDNMCMRYAVEKGISLRDAVREVGKARPDLAAARG